MKLKATNLSSLPHIASELLIFAQDEKIFLFEGEMAAGKTTFIKELCAGLGVLKNVSSPTYSIVNEYQGEKNKIFHFDFYRIKTVEEAFDIGFEEYLDSGAICLIEWPDKIEVLLPTNYIKVKIEVALNGERIFNFSKI
ncbi:tRNA threonylcarbamoyladenosine biosynthesis protein TsaE [Pedobacter sp. UYP30]|uniref:tRNA (adenosine(37)-N6)-threonylcarbamoyltransferase complex ATPase subunit type 1 TsaE n=1 Tax=Pedobacter sp. UYP30 TaxID=1756400 RepID=UPI0033975347